MAHQLDFGSGALPPGLADDIRSQNPWWDGKPIQPLPRLRRWPFDVIHARLLRDRPLARINVIRGPRQIGKTTLQYQIIESMLADGVEPRRILRVQFDALPSLRKIERSEPILRIVAWYAQLVLLQTLNEAARSGKPAYLFLDEVQNLPDWAIELKALVDRADVRVLVTGSSALRIERGRDSLAGRIQSLEVGPFTLSEIAAVRGFGSLKPFESRNGWSTWAEAGTWRALRTYALEQQPVLDLAFGAFSDRGGYPLAQRADVEWHEVAAQLNETVIRRVIQHDLRVGERGRRRDPQLLEEVFRMAARYCGQSPSLSSLARQAQDALEANVGVQRIGAYLEFLNESLLLRLIEPHEMRLKRRRGAPKLCLSDHALRAAWLDELVPIDAAGLMRLPDMQDIAGRIAESVAGQYLVSLGIRTAYLPERGSDPEIDFILTAGDYRVPVEIKYQQRIDPVRDTEGLRRFIAKPVNRAKVGLLVTRDFVSEEMPKGIVAVPLKALLLAR